MNNNYRKELIKELKRENQILFYFRDQYTLLQALVEGGYVYYVWDRRIITKPDCTGFINITDESLVLEELIQRLV